MTRQPFLSAADLTTALEGSAPPIVLDASYRLDPPASDGDYSSGPSREAWLEAHIPGSVYVDIQAQFSDPSSPMHYTHPAPQAIADELARLGVGPTDAVVVYDTSNTMFAARLWYLLTWIGVDVRVLDGGLAAWIASGAPVASGEVPARPAVEPWAASPTRAAWVEARELASRAADDSRPLVCGLPAGTFSGRDATRYSRRGHIPGSVNVSSRDLFASDGTVVAGEMIRGAYAAEGVLDGGEVLLYCGGGISASANALTLAAIGVTDVRIYDGSLEEWSADATLPLKVTA